MYIYQKYSIGSYQFFLGTFYRANIPSKVTISLHLMRFQKFIVLKLCELSLIYVF